MVLKKVGAKVQTFWTTTKRIVVMLACWGLVFSIATIGRLAVAFDYDDTLVFSAPAYAKAFAAATVPYSPQFWSVLNQSYDLERPKLVSCSLAWFFRLFGFRVSILTSRQATDGEALRKEWRHLTPKGHFIFTGDKSSLHNHLKEGNYLLFFGDKDSDIAEARKADVYPIRIRRSTKSAYKEDYHPGTMGELSIPLSEY